MDVTQLFTQLGPFVGLVVVIGMALWKCATWFAPRVDKVVDGHVEYLQSSKKVMESQAATLTELSAMVGDIHNRVIVTGCSQNQRA
jgi:hypothetical protein